MQLIIRAAGWFLIMTIYWAVDWLNFVQALKTGFLGALTILTLTAWTVRDGTESRFGKPLNGLTAFLFLGISGYHAFLRDVFGVAQDDMIVVEALFNTNGGEASEFISQNLWYLGKHVFVLVVAVSLYWLLLGWHSRTSRFKKAGGPAVTRRNSLAGRSGAITLTVLLAVVHLNPTMRKEDPLLYFPIRKAKWERSVEKTRVMQEKIVAALSTDRSLATMTYTGEGTRTVVFVLGESVTRHNWSLFGYPRLTNPELEALGDSLTRFDDVITTLGSTVGDIRLIMGPATREKPELYAASPDLLIMARSAGYKTFWITNHSTDMAGALSIIAGHADVTVNVNRGGSRGEGSYDEVALPELERALDDRAPRKLIILHLLQAHPAFYFRYPEPFALFNDADDEVARRLRSEGRSLRARKMRDFYDNAMLYVDHILRATIDLCAERQDQSIAWLYVPDHGEDVAHYSNFVGHNNRVPTMFEIPMLLWRSKAFPLGAQETVRLSERPYQTDILDHTLLGLMGIKGDYYDPQRDILSSEFVPVPRFAAGKPYP